MEPNSNNTTKGRGFRTKLLPDFYSSAVRARL